jgi:hypothetical protein
MEVGKGALKSYLGKEIADEIYLVPTIRDGL